MSFWGWFWHLLAGLPWGMIGTVIAAVLFVVIGVMEATWRLFRGVGAFAQARQKIEENAIDWRLWTGLITMIGILCLSMFAFYVVQFERGAVLPVEWRDGRWFLLCAILGSWTFSLAVFKLMKGEIDWRLTTVFFMLGWLCIAGAGSWLRKPQPDNATEEYLKAVQRLKLLPGSDDGPKWIGWGLLAGGVFLMLIVPAVGARLWWRPNGGRMRAEARKATLEASILRFKRARAASGWCEVHHFSSERPKRRLPPAACGMGSSGVRCGGFSAGIARGGMCALLSWQDCSRLLLHGRCSVDWCRLSSC